MVLYSLAELQICAGLTDSQLETWLNSGILRPKFGADSSLPVGRVDLLIGAVLGHLRRFRVPKRELHQLAETLYWCTKVVDRLDMGSGDFATLIYHATLRLADAQGCFLDIGLSPDSDPYLRLYDDYSSYFQWLEAIGELPDQPILDAAASLEPEDLEPIRLYAELCDETYTTGTGTTPFWDFYFGPGQIRFDTRTDAAVPWDPAEECDVPAFISVSLPVLARQVEAHLAISRAERF